MRLSDAGFAADHHERSSPRQCLFERALQVREFLLAADERDSVISGGRHRRRRKPAQVRSNFCHGRITLVAGFRQQPPDQHHQALRQIAAQVRRVAQNRRHSFRRRSAAERMRASENLAQQDSKRKQIRALVEGFSPHLLRRHVVGGPDRGAEFRQCRVRGGHGSVVIPSRPRRHELLGQPEVHHLHVAARRQHHVGRLQIAMDESVVMRFLQRFGHFARDPQCFQ